MTDRVRDFMINTLGAYSMGWDIPGPPHTNVDRLQCWAVHSRDRARLVIVEIYKDDGGFDVFPQILPNSLKATASVIEFLADLEDAQSE